MKFELADLGLESSSYKVFESLIKKTHGIILVTGPTGSGKSTTLYSVLVTLNNDDVNILTVEDPIEYQLQGVGQMQVKPGIDLTFASGLRSILRQDPDIIMIRNSRDCRSVGTHRAQGFFNAAYQRCSQRNNPSARHGSRAISHSVFS